MTPVSESDKLIETMLQAFDNRSIEKTLRERLNKNIVDLIPNKELMTFVVKAAATERWTEDLVEAALLEQPDSLAIRRLAVYDPLTALIEKNKKSAGTGSEIAQVVSCLLRVLNQTSPSDIKPEIFTVMHQDLKDLYSEYTKLSEGVTAS
ncbi:MAG TPA: effector-associated domain EAD1-containing protein [Pyrinomonadaceae bacterium]|nr:effector-associated domain EAD1-containing protein [Pyrinomonadaceae bacterium]